MPEFVLSAPAERDLFEIWAYIAADNPSAADRLVDRMADACRRLAEFPETGRERPELQEGLRSLPVDRYVIFYRKAIHGTVEVARILSAYRDIDQLF